MERLGPRKQKGFIINPFRFGASGADPYFSSVVALCHFDGTNGSTTMTDSSSYARALTAQDNAQISTAQSVFGGASLLLDGTNDRVTSTSSVQLGMGTADFTFEGWLRTSTMNRAILDLRLPANTGIFFGVAVTTGYLQAFCNSGTSVNGFGSTNVCDGNWHSFAFSRVAGVMYFFVDGNADGSIAMANNISGGQMFVGCANNNTVNFNGNLDELRLTNGVGRYTSSYTPTGPFPNF